MFPRGRLWTHGRDNHVSVLPVSESFYGDKSPSGKWQTKIRALGRFETKYGNRDPLLCKTLLFTRLTYVSSVKGLRFGSALISDESPVFLLVKSVLRVPWDLVEVWRTRHTIGDSEAPCPLIGRGLGPPPRESLTDGISSETWTGDWLQGGGGTRTNGRGDKKSTRYVMRVSDSIERDPVPVVGIVNLGYTEVRNETDTISGKVE